MSLPLLLTTVGIVNERKEILFIRRANEPFHGLYSLPGGKLEENETIQDGAIREIQEELGITLTDIAPLGHIELTQPGHAIVFIFTSTVSSTIDMRLSPKEAMETTWVPVDKLHTLGPLPPNHENVTHIIFDKLASAHRPAQTNKI